MWFVDKCDEYIWIIRGNLSLVKLSDFELLTIFTICMIEKDRLMKSIIVLGKSKGRENDRVVYSSHCLLSEQLDFVSLAFT